MKTNTLNSTLVAYLFAPLKERINQFQGGYGTALVPGMDHRSFSLSDNTGPVFVEERLSGPAFTDRFMKKMPTPGDELILQVDSNGKVLSWGYNEFWAIIERRVAKRPQFRVMASESFLSVAKSKHFKQVAIGHIGVIVGQCPRDGRKISLNDKFAPVYVNGPITVTNRFERMTPEGSWVPCEDPRPFPVGPKFRLMYNNQGAIGALKMGTALEINWEFPRGTNDPLVQYQSSNTFTYWECYGESATGMEWCEVSDPRPEPVVLVKAKKQKTKKSGQAQGGKQFGHELKSFEGLDSLLVAKR